MSHLLLRVVEGPDAGREARADGELLIGRGEGAELALDDPGVSRRHALIRVDGSTAAIEDLGSRNGTHVNDEPLADPRRIGDGDRIGVGSSTLELRTAPTESAEAPGSSTEVLTPPDSRTLPR